MIVIRAERTEDIRSIRAINLASFPGEGEANLVDTLRNRGKLTLSLVAEEDTERIGHIAFSRVTLQEQPDLYGLGLGPMAVIPAMQRQGIGSDLLRFGLEECVRFRALFVVVLGHRQFYPRFGFRPAKMYGISCRWRVPDDVFMLLELKQGVLTGIKGRASYEPEFDDV